MVLSSEMRRPMPKARYLPISSACCSRVLTICSFHQQRVIVHAARSEPPTPQARSAARAAQRREQERAARAKERRLRRRERLEQYDEEYRLREQ
jgi:hypothetical protein